VARPSPVARRLHYIRKKKKLTLRNFWKRLVGEPNPTGFTVSEAAVRNYDLGLGPDDEPREPAYSYLERVLECFPDVRAEWLLRDEGEPFDLQRVQTEPGTVKRPLGDVVWEYFVEGCGFNPPASLRPVALLLWQRRSRAFPYGAADPFEPARHVGAALFSSLRAFHLDPAAFPDDVLENIALAMLPGVAVAADYVSEPEPEPED
jgi:hypothetical protein